MTTARKLILLSSLLSLMTLASCGDSTSDPSEDITPTISIVNLGGATTQTTLTLAASESQTTLDIIGNTAWSVTVSDSWLTVTPLSGSKGRTTITISAPANDNTENRSATVTVTAEKVSQTLAVTQSGRPAVVDDGHESAADAVANMYPGLNIGNTLDAYGTWVYTTNPLDYENCWGNPSITRELIRAYASAGFKGIRLPVTWWQKTDDNGTVDSRWMARVDEVCGWILDEGITMPTDSAQGHLMLSFHDYNPYNFCLSGEDDSLSAIVWNESTMGPQIDADLDRIVTKFVANGIPVYCGEFGVTASDHSESDIAAYALYFARGAHKRGIAYFYWFDLINRTSYSWKLPSVRDNLLNR